MPWDEKLFDANGAYAVNHRVISWVPPARKLVVLTCMDARIDPCEILGLSLGDAHLLRNAGARVTDDVIRSLAISQQALGTRDIFLMPHTGCGLVGLDPEAIRAGLGLSADVSSWDFLSIGTLTESLREDLERVKQSPWIASDSRISGAIFDVQTGKLARLA